MCSLAYIPVPELRMRNACSMAALVKALPIACKMPCLAVLWAYISSIASHGVAAPRQMMSNVLQSVFQADTSKCENACHVSALYCPGSGHAGP